MPSLIQQWGGQSPAAHRQKGPNRPFLFAPHSRHKECVIQEFCCLAGPFCLTSVRGELWACRDLRNFLPHASPTAKWYSQKCIWNPQTLSRQSWDMVGLNFSIPFTGSHCPHHPPESIYLPSGGWRRSAPRLDYVCSWLHYPLIPVF